MKTIETIDPSPFRHLISTIGELPTSFTESMSYYELLAWLCNYIEKTVVPAVDNNAEALVELRDFVIHYFDSTDFQAMVNAKLDEMATDGTLANLINQEIFGELNDKVTQNSNDIDSLEDSVDALEEKMDFANAGNMVQSFIWNDPDASNVCQGACYDASNDVLYVYVPLEGSYTHGTIRKFSLNNHSYLGKIDNVPLFHGNGLTYLNNNLYAASFYDASGNATNTVIKQYNLTNGTTDTLDYFGDLGYARSFGVTSIDDNTLIVAMSASASRNVSEVHFIKYNIISHQTSEYTRDFNGYRVNASEALVDIQYSDGKLYLLTDKDHQIFEFNLTDTTATLNKVYRLPYYDEEGLYLGEMEGFCAIPADNNKSFLLVSGTEFESEPSILGHEINLETNLVPYLTSKIGKQTTDYIDAIYCNATSSATVLIEEGTETRPFTRLNRAIDFQNKYNVSDIYLQDSSTYQLGRQVGKRLSIRWVATNTPTVVIRELIDCQTYIRTTTRSGYIRAASSHEFQIKGGNTIFDYMFINCQLTLTGSAQLIVGSTIFDLENAANAAVNVERARAQIRTSGISNYLAANPIRIGNNGFAVLGSMLSSSYTRASGGVVIVGDD